MSYPTRFTLPIEWKALLINAMRSDRQVFESLSAEDDSEYACNRIFDSRTLEGLLNYDVTITLTDAEAKLFERHHGLGLPLLNNATTDQPTEVRPMELFGYEIDKKEVFSVAKSGSQARIFDTFDSATEWIKDTHAYTLGFNARVYSIAYSTANGMFDMYCANTNRDADYWFGGISYDLNFCTDKDGNCSVTLYHVKPDGTTDTSKFMRLFERQCDVGLFESKCDTAPSNAFQSTVRLLGGEYNLTIKEV